MIRFFVATSLSPWAFAERSKSNTPTEMLNCVDKSFLTAEWRYLAILNYEIDPALLLPFVPKGTELDYWNDTTFASMVGFLFLDTRVLGMAIPFIETSKRSISGFTCGTRPRMAGAAASFRQGDCTATAIAWTARWLYNENYVACPPVILFFDLRRSPPTSSLQGITGLTGGDRLHRAETRGEPYCFAEGSQEEFVSQHYWGYSAQKDGGTIQYRVEHPAWRIWQAAGCKFDCDVEPLYGKPFAKALIRPPLSAFLAERSAVTVYKGKRVG